VARKPAPPAGEFIDYFCVGRADDAVRAVYLKVLVNRNFFRKEIVLDKHDGEAARATFVDHPPNRCEQARGFGG
jgi:hypothetical protein